MQTKAFILTSQPANEYDRNYTLLTKDLGVIEAFARSVRKPNAKLSGHLEPPNLSWVELVESQRGWQVTSALEEDSYRPILLSAAALRTVLQAGWLLREFVPISHPDEELWELWSQFIENLSRYAGSNAATSRGIFAQFLIKLLHHLGFLADPADIASGNRRVEESLRLILSGKWLNESQCREPWLWETAKSAAKNAKRFMI
jgi:DNA repair protein RecO (recombination protein O)